MEHLYEAAKQIGDVEISDNKWKLSIACSEGDNFEAE